MDCMRAQKLMPLAIGGDVTAATRAAVEAHAAACDSCRGEWERYCVMRASLQAVRVASEPPGGWGGIWAGVAEVMQKRCCKASIKRPFL